MKRDRRSRRRRARRALLVLVLGVVVLVCTGVLFADHLTPRATGVPSHALPVQPVATSLDREVQPLLDAHPGRTGTLLLDDGVDAFAARAIAARHAGRSLDLMYYIWHDDVAGRLLAQEAHAAAVRGVRVRILLDDMNAEGLDPQMLALDAHPNIELRLYNPFRNREGVLRVVEMVQRLFSVNHRMHNKAWIADGRVAIIGGRNIGEEYFDASADVNFRDLDLLLVGPAVGDAGAVFDAYWNSAGAIPVAALASQSPAQLEAMLASARSDAGAARAQPYLARVAASQAVHDYLSGTLATIWSDGVRIVADPPLKERSDRRAWIVEPLVATIESARRKVLLVSPYFVPGEEGVAVLSRMAGQGIHVGVVTNSLAANDVPAVHSGYAAYRGALVDAGVHVHELRRTGAAPAGRKGRFGSRAASLHTKAFVVDDRRGFVGSFNLDPRSADLNTEMGVLFDDPRIAAGVRASYLRLAAPARSYTVVRGRDGDLRWLDAAAAPPVLLDAEPETTAMQRFQARAIGWLPIESQL